MSDLEDTPQIQSPDYMERLKQSQESLRRSLRRDRWRTRARITKHFKDRYGDDYKQHMK